MEQDTEFRDTVVTLLLDNSGSMREDQYQLLQFVLMSLQEHLRDATLKLKFLVLQHRAWKGGQSRERWLNDGRPQQQVV